MLHSAAAVPTCAVPPVKNRPSGYFCLLPQTKKSAVLLRLARLQCGRVAKDTLGDNERTKGRENVGLSGRKRESVTSPTRRELASRDSRVAGGRHGLATAHARALFVASRN
jgi:hypothetical protein